MSRGQQTFRERDVTKAIKAAVKAGIPVERVEIDKQGKIIIVTAKAQDAVSGEEAEKNEWDGVLQ
jgi:hypothetical protein